MIIPMKIKSKYSNTKIYFFSLNNANVPIHIDGVSIRKAKTIDYIFSFFSKKSPSKLSISRHIRRGDDYYLARIGNSTVSIGRICYKNTREIILKKKEASLISFYTIPEYRRQGLYVALLQKMLQDLKNRGFHTAYIWADQKNTASLRGIERSGFIQTTTDRTTDHF